MRTYRPMTWLATLYNLQSEGGEHGCGELGQQMGFPLLNQPVTPDAVGQPDPSTLPGLLADASAHEPSASTSGRITFIRVYRDLITAEAKNLKLPTLTATELEIRHSNAMIGLVGRYFTSAVSRLSRRSRSSTTASARGASNRDPAS
jgi:putative tryptophan/tyrosine transport system substrate-binding protein